jgi:3-deoxy-D-manno-octulosonate 8-phosphate phosphatase (KDO 8-P phosphatase)
MISRKPQHLIFDVDGVFTDGKFYYTADGKVMKAFCCQDSDGLRDLMGEFNIHLITADKNGFEISQVRAKDMGFPIHLVPNADRAAHVAHYVKFGGAIFMGDSMTDIPALREATYAIVPKQSRIEVRDEADYVTAYAGGEGAVLDACLHLKEKFRAR